MELGRQFYSHNKYLGISLVNSVRTTDIIKGNYTRPKWLYIFIIPRIGKLSVLKIVIEMRLFLCALTWTLQSIVYIYEVYRQWQSFERIQFRLWWFYKGKTSPLEGIGVYYHTFGIFPPAGHTDFNILLWIFLEKFFFLPIPIILQTFNLGWMRAGKLLSEFALADLPKRVSVFVGLKTRPL